MRWHFTLLVSLDLYFQIFSPPWVLTHLSHVRNTGKDRKQQVYCTGSDIPPLAQKQDRVSSVFISCGRQYLKCLNLKSSHLTVSRNRSSWLSIDISIAQALVLREVPDPQHQCHLGTRRTCRLRGPTPNALPQKLWRGWAQHGCFNKPSGDSDTC